MSLELLAGSGGGGLAAVLFSACLPRSFSASFVAAGSLCAEPPLASRAVSLLLRRSAARCVLLDSDRRVFLIRSADPIDPHKPEWLEIPGGGVGPGEDSAAACLRELHEETGIRDVEMGPCVWTQYVEYTFCGMRFESDERIHVAWCEGGEFRPAGLEALEAAAFIDAGWWTVEELQVNREPTVPARLREFLPALAAGDIADPPIDISPDAHA